MRRLTKWQKWCAGIGVLLALLYLTFGVILYGPIARKVVRKKAIPKIEKKLGRKVAVGNIDVGYGAATLHDVVILDDHNQPTVTLKRVEVEFGYWASLFGVVDIGEANIVDWNATLHRDRYGKDNVSDILARLRGRKTTGEGGGGGSIMPSRVTLRGGTITATDDFKGVTAQASNVSGEYKPGEGISLLLGNASGSGPFGSDIRLKNVSFSGDRSEAKATLKNAGVTLWTGMELTSIDGAITMKNNRVEVDFDGSYGGSSEKLWEAKGNIATPTRTGKIQLKASQFKLARIGEYLEGGMFRDFQETEVGAEVTIEFDGDNVRPHGYIEVAGANLYHRKLADETLEDVSFRGTIDASYNLPHRKMILNEARLTSGGVAFVLTGDYSGYSIDEKTTEIIDKPVLSARLVVPTVDCTKMQDAIPRAMIPQLRAYRLSGSFSADIGVKIDWANLDDTVLKSRVGIDGCRVRNGKDTRIANLKGQFVHTVEVERGKWRSIIIGPENPDYVPIEQISIHLRKSLMTTEDSRFYRHDGFIKPEFRTALVKNLKAGYFRYGASSITMQMVKNVLLHRQKTLSRKLQELFLTWHVEQMLSKDRIYEIYLNAIEYGPDVYGIGPAAHYYFGKPAGELTPREASFFSSILPSPKKRSKQFCTGKLSRWTTGKMDRVLKLMHKRGRLGLFEMEEALATPLEFARQEDKAWERKCLKKVKHLIRNRRRTNETAPSKQKAVEARRYDAPKKPRTLGDFANFEY